MKSRARDFRQTARESLKDNWFRAIVAGFVASIFGASTTAPSISITISAPAVDPAPSVDGSVEQVSATIMNATQYSNEEIASALVLLFGVIAIGALIYSIFMLVIGSPVRVGFAQFNIDLIEGSRPRVVSLFSKFRQMGVSIRANILVFLRVLLGSFLFFIPGIIWSYSYSMVSFVLADNPGMNAREALAESKRIMKGYKWRLFCLTLSFFGWFLLAAFTFGLGLLYVGPYYEAAIAALYCEARDNA